MPKITIKPTVASPNYKRVTATGAAEITAITDASDATYLRRRINGEPLARYALQVPSIPYGSDVATVVPGGRFKQPTSVPPKMVTLAIASGTPVGPSIRAGSGTSAYTYATPASAGQPLSPAGPWASRLKYLALIVHDGHIYSDANRAYIYELSADVYYAAQPTCALTITPGSPVATTSYPTLTAALTALVESWQDASGPLARTELYYDLKIFSAAQYGASGFSPLTSPAFWASTGLLSDPLDYIDGVTLSTVSMPVPVTTPLVNGTYRAYVRAKRYFTGADYGAWATLDFTVAVAPPTSPTFTATVDNTNQRVVLAVTPVTSTGATNPLVTVERSSDGGATWQPVRNASDVPGTFGVQTVIYDYEAPRATALVYRANVEATVSSQQLVSLWTVVSVSGTISAAGWNLKCPSNPSINLINATIVADPSWTQAEDASVFRPLGRTYPVVVSLALGGHDGSCEANASSTAEWALLQSLMATRTALLLESPFGWARYIRLTSRSWQETGAASSPVWQASLDFLEVEMP